MTSLARDENRHATTGILVAVGLLLLVFGFAILLAVPSFVMHSNPVWFIGLLIIFGASLALIAVVFRWLGLHAPGEAFGLPSGSIRTLLAVGVMVLFAVFGLAAISTDKAAQRPAEQPLQQKPAEVNGDAAAVEAEIKRYRALNVVAVPVSRGASGAQLMLYRLESYTSPNASELQKQIITALVTLLTSVVSFYFGSRTVEASRDAQKKGGDPIALPESVAGDIKALDDTLADLRKRLTALQADKATPGNETTLATRLSQASADLQKVEASRVQIDAASKDLASGGSTAEALSAAVGALKTALASLAELLSQAEALVAKG